MHGLDKIGNAIILPFLLQTMLTTNARSRKNKENVTPSKNKNLPKKKDRRETERFKNKKS